MILTCELRTLQNTDKIEELKAEKVVSKWRGKVAEKESHKELSKNRSDQPPKLVRASKSSSNPGNHPSSGSSEGAAKKWLSKSKTRQLPRQPPSSASSKWATARSRTMAVNRLASLPKPAPGSLNTRGNLAQNSGSLVRSNSIASKASSIQSNKPSSLQNKSFLPSSSGPSKPVPGPRTNWQKAAVKTKSVSNFSKPASSTVGAKKPYVPYKAPAKSGVGARPGLGGAGKKGPAKFGGGKMGGKFF